MDMMLAPLRKYADFEGRARRSEYWLFWLFRALVYLGITVIGMILIGVTAAATGGAPDGDVSPLATAVTGLIMLLFLAAVFGFFLPSLAVLVRRLHDAGMSGWLVLIAFVPFGGLVLFIFTLLDGTPGKNQYGPNPKEPSGQAAVFG